MKMRVDSFARPNMCRLLFPGKQLYAPTSLSEMILVFRRGVKLTAVTCPIPDVCHIAIPRIGRPKIIALTRAGNQ